MEVIDSQLSKAESAPRVMRQARALIGWMTPDGASMIQSGQQMGVIIPAEKVERAQNARETVAKRNPNIDQSNLIQDMPPELQDYATSFWQNQATQIFAAEGWRIALADISRVCGMQPTVFLDHANERVETANPEDWLSLANITLPIPTPTNIHAQLDHAKMAWMVSDANPNLRIVGGFNKNEAGVILFGFAIAISPSFMQVVSQNGRYFLRDGNHRAVGLLKKGIKTVPVLTRDYASWEDMGIPQGLLPQGAYTGQRPPLLPDYLDDTVSAQVELPASQKIITIQGTELNLMLNQW